jgi:hypothetical protein
MIDDVIKLVNSSVAVDICDAEAIKYFKSTYI